MKIHSGQDNKAVSNELSQLFCFKSLSQEQIQDILNTSTWVEFTSGERILRQGQISNRLYFLWRGRVSLRRDSEPLLWVHQRGELLGEFGILNETPSWQDVVAEEDCVLLMVDWQRVNSAEEASIKLIRSLLYRVYACILEDRLSRLTDKTQNVEELNQQLLSTQQDLQFKIEESHRLQDSLKRNQRMLTLQNRITTLFLVESEHTLFQNLVKVLCETFHFRLGMFGRLDEANRLTCDFWDKQAEAHWYGKNEQHIPFEIWREMPWSVAMEYNKSGVLQQARFCPYSQRMTNQLVYFPLIHQFQVIGLIVLADTHVPMSDFTLSELQQIMIYIAPLFQMKLKQQVAQAQNKVSSKQLELTRERFERATKAAKVGIWDLDIESGVLFLDQNILHLLGYEEVECSRTVQEWCSLFQIEQQENMNGLVNKALKHPNQEFLLEHEARCKNGDMICMEVRGQVQLGATGKPEQLVGTAMNITHRKRAEQRNQVMTEQLQQSQKLNSLGTLAGGIAHDFNNLLTAITGYTELVHRALPRSHQMRENLESVLQASFRAKDLVKQILTFSRRNEKNPHEIEPQTVIKESVRFLQGSLPSTVEIKVNISQEPMTVFVDHTQLHQVVMNLCTNAFQAMENQRGTIEISMHKVKLKPGELAGQTGEGGQYAMLSVRDNGQGMSNQVRERIFDPYFTTKNSEIGTGLGLSVVHGIVNTHHGFIQVQSELGVGTEVTVFLPATKKNPLPSRQHDILPIKGGTERVLLVDDESMILQFLEETLNSLGYGVASFNCPKTALNTLRQQPSEFDLVITDQVMPQITGDQLAMQIREINQLIPIILLSASHDAYTSRKEINSAVNLMLGKPILMEELAVRMRDLLDHQRAK